MLRGIGDPLIAAYARVYLCRVGMRLSANDRRFAWKVLHDWLQTFEPYERISLLWPAVEWLIHCVAYLASYDELLSLWEYAKQHDDKRQLLMTPLLVALPPSYLVANAVDACDLVLNNSDSTTESAQQIAQFGRRILQSEPSPDVKRHILRCVWRSISKLKSLNDYIDCADVWIEFACRYFGTKEINAILENVVRRIQPDKV